VNCDLFASGSADKMLKIWSLEIDNENTGPDNGEQPKGKKKIKTNAEGNAWNKVKVPLLTLAGHTEQIAALTWLSDKNTSNDAAPEIATCSMDNTIRIWDIEVSEAKQTLVGSKAFLAISYSPLNNLLVTGSTDRHVRLWDPRCQEGSMVKETFTSHTNWVTGVAWSPSSENHFISGAYDNVVKYWDIRSPKASLYDLIGHKDRVLCVNWSNKYHVISGAADNQLKIFTTELSAEAEFDKADTFEKLSERGGEIPNILGVSMDTGKVHVAKKKAKGKVQDLSKRMTITPESKGDGNDDIGGKAEEANSVNS